MSRLLIVDPECALFDCLPPMARALSLGFARTGLEAPSLAELLDTLREGRMAELARQFGALPFGAALRQGAVLYQERFQFTSPRYPGVRHGLSELRRRNVQLAIVSRMPETSVRRLLATLDSPLKVAWYQCPATPSCAQFRRQKLADLVARGVVLPGRDAVLSDDLLDLSIAESLGLDALFAAYGRTTWTMCRSIGVGKVVMTARDMAYRFPTPASGLPDLATSTPFQGLKFASLH